MNFGNDNIAVLACSAKTGIFATGMAIIPEKASRALYVVEAVVFALLPVWALGTWTILYGFGSLFMFLFSVVMLVDGILAASPSDAWEALSHLVLFGGIAALAGSGGIALLKFLWLSLIFVRQGAAELQKRRRTFYRCVAWAVLPLVATHMIFPSFADRADERAFLIFVSGSALGMPLLHLWLELRYRQPYHADK